MIPLGEQTSQCVTIVWTEARDTPVSPNDAVPRPAAGRVGKASTLVSVHLPPDRILKTVISGLELVGSEHVDQERSDRIAQRITEFLAEIDRGSGRDRDRLTSLLINHELALRTVEHAFRPMSRRGHRTVPDAIGRSRELEVVKASRAAVLEAVRSVGLEEQIEAAARSIWGSPPRRRTRKSEAFPSRPASTESGCSANRRSSTARRRDSKTRRSRSRPSPTSRRGTRDRPPTGRDRCSFWSCCWDWERPP